MLWRNIVIPRVILILFVQLVYQDDSVIAQNSTSSNVTDAPNTSTNDASAQIEANTGTSNATSSSNVTETKTTNAAAWPTLSVAGAQTTNKFTQPSKNESLAKSDMPSGETNTTNATVASSLSVASDTPTTTNKHTEPSQNKTPDKSAMPRGETYTTIVAVAPTTIKKVMSPEIAVSTTFAATESAGTEEDTDATKETNTSDTGSTETDKSIEMGKTDQGTSGMGNDHTVTEPIAGENDNNTDTTVGQTGGTEEPEDESNQFGTTAGANLTTDLSSPAESDVSDYVDQDTTEAEPASKPGEQIEYPSTSQQTEEETHPEESKLTTPLQGHTASATEGEYSDNTSDGDGAGGGDGEGEGDGEAGGNGEGVADPESGTNRGGDVDEDGGGDGEDTEEPGGLVVEVVEDDDDVLGEYAAMVAYTLRENLINLCGYLMYQITVDTEPEVYFYIHELKTGLLANNVDVFKIMEVLPELYNQKLNDQLRTLLQQIENICETKYCHVKCTTRMLRQHSIGIDMDTAVGHFGYNPILNGIVDKSENLQRLQNLINKLKMNVDSKTERAAMTETEIFSPVVMRILQEVQERQTSMSDQLIGYLLPFYPWPLDDYDIELALSVMTRFLIDERMSLIKCGVEARKDLIETPIDAMTKLMTDIINSKCNRPEKMAAQVLLNALDEQLTFPDYRNTFKGVYAEINRLWELIDIVDFENYPLEVVLARSRLRGYLDKIVFYLNYPRFVAYKYNTEEETLIAFLDFVSQEAPHPPISIKLSIAALKAYLVFYTGPRRITYSLLLTIIDGFMAPDLNDNIIEEFIDVKTYVLDQAVVIGRILQAGPVKKCTDMLACYFEIIAILKESSEIGDDVSYLDVPECILRRFINQDLLDTDLFIADTSEPVHITTLLGIVDYHQYTREVVLSAIQVRDHIKQYQDTITINTDNVFCTKQETLLDYLKYILQNNPKYPNAVLNSIKALIPALTFKVTPLRFVTVETVKLITEAWHSPFVDEKTMLELTRVEAILQSNEKDMDERLHDMNTHECISLLGCYNAIVDHLNNQESPFNFKHRMVLSPELYVLNLGKMAPMTTQLVVNIINAVQTHDQDDSELEASKAYILDFEIDVDVVLRQVDCSHQQVIQCFKTVLNQIRFSDYVSHVQVNIIQYLLIPTTCDKRNCWWLPNEESGSTVLNPLLQYMMYLLEHYSINEVKSLHIQMEINQIVQYLDMDDVQEILVKFKIKTCKDNMEKLILFLSLLLRSTLMEQHLHLAVNNVYVYLSKNEFPTMLNIGNLYYFKVLFKTYTANNTVHVELDDIEDKIRLKMTAVVTLLKYLYVDCFTLDKCITTINAQLSIEAFDKPATKLIKQLLKPDSCMEDKTICPWIVLGLTGTEFIKQIVIPIIEEILNGPGTPLIEVLVWKLIVDKLEVHTEWITSQIVLPENIEDDKEKIQWIIEKILEHKLPEKVKQDLIHIRDLIKDITNGIPLDTRILIEILLKMQDETQYEATILEITQLITLVENNRKKLETVLGKIVTSCKDLKECVKVIFEGIIIQGVATKEIFKLIVKIFLAKQCPKGDCPWQVIVDIQKATYYKNQLEQYLVSIQDRDDTPLHVKLDLSDVLEYLETADVLDIIYNVILFTDEKEIVNQILITLSQNKDIPQNIRISIKVIIEYISKNQTPAFLQVTNLIRLILLLKDQAGSNIVKRVLDNAVIFLKKYKANATTILEICAIDCTTISTCVNTLYVEMDKNSDDNVAKIILSVINPSACKIKTCPWTKELVEKLMKEVEEILQKELESLQKGKEVPLHIKLDVQVFKKIVKECTDSLAKVVEISQRSKPDKLLPIFITTLENDVLVKYEMEHIKVDLENYLVSGSTPKYMDVSTLLIYGALLIKMTKSEEVKRDIEQQKVKIVYEKHEVRVVMLHCPVNCVNVKKCALTMELCLQDSPVSEEPQSVTVSKLIRPDSCDATACPWLPVETHEQIVKKFEEIKVEIKDKAEDENTPIIIYIILETFLGSLQLDKVMERYLMKITTHNPSKLLELLKLIRKDKKNYPEESVVQVVKLIEWLQSGKIPSYLTSTELPGLVKYLVDLTNQPDVKVFLEMALNLILKKPKQEIDTVLKQCPVECIEIKPCLTQLAICLKKSQSITAWWLWHIIIPDPCTAQICPWMPDIEEVGQGGNNTFPVDNPHTIPSNKVVIFYVDFQKLKSVTLDLSSDRTLVMLEALTFLAEILLRRTTVVNSKGSPKKYMIDYAFLKGIVRIGKDKEPVMDFGGPQFNIICVRYKNGNIRPLKFDLTKEGVKEDLIKLSHNQRPVVEKQKPMVTLIDSDGGKSTLSIDVLDSNALRQIMLNTIDDVMPEDYVAVFFWPKEMGEPWKAAVIEEKSPLESYLRNLPGMDFANKETPVLVMFDGIITMDFDVNNVDIVAGIETAVGNQTTVLDLGKQKKYMFYIPFPFQKNMIPFAVDFTNPGALNILIKACEKYKNAEWTLTTITVIKEDGESVPLQFDFYGDVLLYLFHHLKPGEGGVEEGPDADTSTTAAPPQENIEETLHLVILFSNDEFALLDLSNADVQKKLLEDFTVMPHGRKLFMVSVPNPQGGVIPIVIDSTDSDVFNILRSLSAATSKPFPPIKVATPNKTNIIVCVAEDDIYSPAPLVVEDTAECKNRLKNVEAQQAAKSDKYTFPFSSGSIQVAQVDVALLAATDPPNLEMKGLTYVGGKVHLQEVVVPIQTHGVLYHMTLDTTKPEVVDFLQKYPYDPNESSSIIFVYQDAAFAFHMADIPTTSEEAISGLKQIATGVQVDVAFDTLMVIMTLDENMLVKSFILNTNSERVMNTLKDMELAVDPESTTKAIFHCEDADGEILPIVLDHMEYDIKTFEGLQQETPLEIKTLRIPNIDGKIPLIGFMARDEENNKVSIILNPADRVVWRALMIINKKPGPNSVPIKIVGAKGKEKVFKIDKTDKRVIKRLINVSKRTNPSHIPVSPIPPDDTWILTTYVIQENYKKKVKLNTRNEKVLQNLLDAGKTLPETEPSMLVLGPDGSAVEIKIDTRVYGHQTSIPVGAGGSINFDHNYLVIKPPKGEAILLDVTDLVVSMILLQISSHVTKENVHEVVYVDGSGQIQIIKLDVTNSTAMQILWQLEQKTIPANLDPIIVAPENGKLWLVLVIIDQGSNRKVIILDITNVKVREELIKLWDGTENGLPIKLEDNNSHIITIHIDIMKKMIVRKLIELMQLTEAMITPIVSGISTEKIPIIKIPYIESNKTYIINCNVSDPIVVNKLIKVHGKTQIGVSFTFRDSNDNPSIIYLELKDKKVIRSLKKICPLTSIKLDPSLVLVLDIENVLGEHQTNILDLTNEEIIKQLVEKGKVTNGDTSSNLIEIPIIDEHGIPHLIPIDIAHPSIQELLEQLTGITIGGGMLENIVIPDTGISASTMVIFTIIGPLFIDQANTALIQAIVKLSRPKDPNARKIIFNLSTGKVLVVYLNLSDMELMMQLKVIVDKFFGVPQVVPPTTISQKQIIKIPCIDRFKNAIYIYLDISNPDIMAVLQSVNAGPKGKYNMKITVILNGVTSGIYYIDVTSVQVCEQIKLVAFYKLYNPADGSLVIINLPDAHVPVAILDLTNRQVLAALESISKQTSAADITHLVLNILGRGKTIIYKINVNLPDTVTKLITLTQYTPVPIAPTAIANPYGQTPLVIFTIRISSTGEVKHIVLNLNNKKVIARLKQLSKKVMPEQPLEIVYIQANGKKIVFTIDAGNDKVLTELYKLTKTTMVVKDATLNIQQKNANVITKLVIALPTDGGFSNTIVIDMLDQKQFAKYQDMATHIPKGVAVLVIYFKDANGFTVAVRVDSTKLFPQTAVNPIVQLNPKYVVVFTFMTEGGEVETVILYTLIVKVVRVLVEITQSTPINVPHTSVTIITVNGQLISIRIILTDVAVQDKIRELGQLTPAPSAPIIIPSPYGPKPLLVLTIVVNKKVMGILVDLNNPEVITILDEISNAEDENTWSIEIPGAGGILIEISIDPFLQSVIEQLIIISQLIQEIQAPITGDASLISKITITTEDNVNIEIPVNTQDPYIIQLILDFIKQHPPAENIENSILIYIWTDQGLILVGFDITKPEVIDILIQIGQRVIMPGPFVIIPQTGPEALLVVAIHLADGLVCVTIDPNVPTVVEILKQISSVVQTTQDVTMIYVNPSYGEPFFVTISKTLVGLREQFNKISSHSTIFVCPIQIYPPGGQNPILSIIVPTGHQSVLLVIDFNNPAVVNVLEELHLPSQEGVTTIEFINDKQTNGTRVIINLNLTDANVISTIQNMERPTVYPLPHTDDYPIIVVHIGEETWHVDANNPDVFQILVSLSGKPEDNDKLWTIELKSKEGLTIFVYIDFSNPTVIKKLQEYIVNLQIPPIIVVIPIILKIIKVCPVRIIPPHGKYPLLMIEFWDLGAITININEVQVLEMLMTVSVTVIECNTITISIPDGEGNFLIININPDNIQTQMLLIQITKYTIIYFEVGSTLPILLIESHNLIFILDLSNPKIIAILVQLSKPGNPEAHKIQITLAIHILIVYLIPGEFTGDLGIPQKPKKIPKPTTTAGVITVTQNVSTSYITEGSDYPDVDTPFVTPQEWTLTMPPETTEYAETDAYETEESHETSVDYLTVEIDQSTMSTDDEYPEETDEVETDYTTAWSQTASDYSPTPTPDVDYPEETDEIVIVDTTISPQTPGDYLPPTKRTTTRRPRPTRPTRTTTRRPKPTRPIRTTTRRPRPTRPKRTTTRRPKPTRPTRTTTRRPKPTRPIRTTTRRPKPTRPIRTTTRRPRPTRPTRTTTRRPPMSIGTMTRTTTSKYPTVWGTDSSAVTFEIITLPNWNGTVGIGEQFIYWITFNITNLITNQVITITLDVSNQQVIVQLQIYIESLKPSERIITIVINLPTTGTLIIYLNPYSEYTFIILTELTFISTGQKPPVVGIGSMHIWWSFTITNQYQECIRIELDVGKECIVIKITKLSEMYRPGGGQAMIIKGTLSNGKQYQLIIDVTCPVTIENLLIMVEESHSDGPCGPLKPLPPINPPVHKEYIQIEIRFPGSGKVIIIILDIAKQEVLEELIELDHKYVPGNGNYELVLQINGKVIIIRLSLYDITTLTTLLELSKISTGKEVITHAQLEILIQGMYLPSLLTIVISDGRDKVPVTLDITNKETLEILQEIQTTQTKYATVIKYKDSRNATHTIALNINDRQVIGVLIAISLPTIAPVKAQPVRLLTFIFMKNARNGEFSAILIDMADRNTIIFMVQLMGKYREKFKTLTYLEMRDDNGQYIPIALDLGNRKFMRELMKATRVSRRHRIECSDIPFVVLVIPERKKRTYEVYKFRLNAPAIDVLVTLPSSKNTVSVEIVDTDEPVVFRIDPGHSGLINGVVGIPNIGLVQASNPRPMIIIYVCQNKVVSPIYLNMRDPKTLHKLIEMHNHYARKGGKLPLSVARFISVDNEIYYLLLHLNSQIALTQLSKLSVHIGSHHFVQQRIEKIAALSIPQRHGRSLVLRFNLADEYVLEELRRMSYQQLDNNYVQTVQFVDAYGNPLILKLDFTDRHVIRQLLRLSMKE